MLSQDPFISLSRVEGGARGSGVCGGGGGGGGAGEKHTGFGANLVGVGAGVIISILHNILCISRRIPTKSS